MNIENLTVTKCKIIEPLEGLKFLVEDLLDNKEKVFQCSLAMYYFMKPSKIVYAMYSFYVSDKSVLCFITREKRKGFLEEKLFLDKYLPIEAKYA